MTVIRMIHFATLTHILVLYDEGVIKFIIWSQILTVKAVVILCIACVKTDDSHCLHCVFMCFVWLLGE